MKLDSTARWDDEELLSVLFEEGKVEQIHITFAILIDLTIPSPGSVNDLKRHCVQSREFISSACSYYGEIFAEKGIGLRK